MNFNLKTTILFMLAVVLIASCNAQIKTLPVTDFEKMLTRNDVLLVDVRTPEEFQQQHLPNAININYNSSDFITQIKQLDSTKTLLLYCKSGNRSNKAAQLLQQEGIINVYELEGGITAWNNTHQ